MKQRTFIISIISVLLFLCLPTIAMAQDVIVKKDGGIIQSKVLKVTSTEVEYKKFSNQNGPTYTIKISELISINYENGEIDKFGETKTEAIHVETITPQTTFNQNPQQQYNDAQLLRAYKADQNDIKKYKRLKNIGWISGASMIAIGAILPFAISTEDYVHYLIVVGIPIASGGIITGTTMILVADHNIKKYNSLQSVSILQQEFHLGKQTNLTADVNVLNDKFTNQKTLGLGFHLNF